MKLKGAVVSKTTSAGSIPALDDTSITKNQKEKENANQVHEPVYEDA